MEYYIVQKKSELVIYMPSWMNLTDIMFSNRSHTNEYIPYDCLY